MRARTGLIAGAIAVAGAAPLILMGTPESKPLTPMQQHELDEEREKHAMLIAPPDSGRRFQEPPYDSKNFDGKSGAGGKAVAYRSGAREVTDAAAVAAAPEARLWRTGYGSWEPSMGVTKKGTLVFSARNTNADPGVAFSDDGGRTWRRSKPPEHAASLDPFVWVDEETGSVFASDIDASITCTPISRSDDEGQSWRYSRACGVTDHQHHFGGPPPEGGEQPSGYPNVLYYCAISGGLLSDTSVFTACLKSLDGGLVWEPTGDPAYPEKEGDNTLGAFCNGAAGHGTVDIRGTVYVPRGWCGPPTIAISRDEGATWTRRQVSDKLMDESEHESGVTTDSAGNVYYLFGGADKRAYLTISRDGGNTWSDEKDITPPGVAQVAAFATHIDAGAPGRIAYVFMGTSDKEAKDTTVWSAYMGTSSNALDDDPLFYAAPANDPKTNALWKGECGPLRCGNIGDFLDVEIGPDGSAWTALVDSCPTAKDECIVDLTIDTPRGEGVVGQLVGGPPLRGTTAEQRPRVVLPSGTSAGPGGPGTRRRRCRSRRNFSIRLVEPKRGRLTEAKVYVNGKRVRVIRGKRLKARVNLRGLPRGRYTVRVVATTSTGQRLVRKRRYRTCTPKQRSARAKARRRS